jgi:uncharacterized membrane protein
MTDTLHPSEMTVSQDKPALFSATISPYRSLPLAGFNILMGAAGTVFFVMGIAFWAIGAWPVLGFFGLDILIIYLAFRRNYLDARAMEIYNLTPEQLLVRQVTARGQASEHSFHPYWTRLVVERESWGVSALSLTSSGRRLSIATFLNPSERARFADALSRALAAARATPSPA